VEVKARTFTDFPHMLNVGPGDTNGRWRERLRYADADCEAVLLFET